MYEVLVSEKYRWDTARVAGRIFSKRGVEYIHEHEMTDEIRNSPLLSVVEVKAAEPEPEPDPKKKPAKARKSGGE